MHFMNMIFKYYPDWIVAGSGGGGGTSTMSGILSLAGELVTWIITQMGAYLNFITDNPIVFIYFLLMLAGLGVGMLMRVWRSAR